MQLFIILLILGYSSAGIVEKFLPDSTENINGYERASGKEEADILLIIYKGKLTLELIPFKKVINTQRKIEDTIYYVSVQWRDDKNKVWPLDLVEMKWPEVNKYSLEEARKSIIGMGIDAKNQPHVKYFKSDSTCIIKTYYVTSHGYETGTITACS